MSFLTTSRRTIIQPCSRLLHSSSASQAAILSPDLVEAEVEEISIPPIFDIFDAPARLADSRKFIRARYECSARDTKRPTSEALSSSPLQPVPTPFPPPIIFDGPARPINDTLMHRRRMRDSGFVPLSPTRPKQTPASRPFSSSEPLVQMFEGPARISRYHHQSSRGKEGQQKYLKLLLILGIVGTTAGGALTKEYTKSE